MKMKNWIIMQTIQKMFNSKKFLYTIIGCIVQLLSDKWGIDPATSQSILYSICALVLGQSIADFGKGAKGK